MKDCMGIVWIARQTAGSWTVRLWGVGKLQVNLQGLVISGAFGVIAASNGQTRKVPSEPCGDGLACQQLVE